MRRHWGRTYSTIDENSLKDIQASYLLDARVNVRFAAVANGLSGVTVLIIAKGQTARLNRLKKESKAKSPAAT